MDNKTQAEEATTTTIHHEPPIIVRPFTEVKPRQRRIQEDSPWNTLRNFARTEVAEKTRHLHALSPSDVAETSYTKAQRVSAETVGAVTGLAKTASSAIGGALAGLVAGVKGVSPTTLKRLRMSTDEMIEVGSLHRILKDQKNRNILILRLDAEPVNGELRPLDKPEFRSLSSRETTKQEIELDGETLPVRIAATQQQGSNTITGLLVIADTDDGDNRVWHWFDR